MKKFVTIISMFTDGLAYQVEVDDVPVRQMLSLAWEQTNRDHRPLGKMVCSTTMGDLMLAEGKYFLVDAAGFKEFTPEQALKWQRLDSRDASMGFDWVAKNTTHLT
jgi:hypothetical protein